MNSPEEILAQVDELVVLAGKGDTAFRQARELQEAFGEDDPVFNQLLEAIRDLATASDSVTRQATALSWTIESVQDSVANGQSVGTVRVDSLNEAITNRAAAAKQVRTWRYVLIQINSWA